MLQTQVGPSNRFFRGTRACLLERIPSHSIGTKSSSVVPLRLPTPRLQLILDAPFSHAIQAPIGVGRSVDKRCT